MFVLKEFEFDAAHYLPEYNGKCERLHGHTYKLVVKVEGTPDKEGMVIDFIRGNVYKKCCRDPTISFMKSRSGKLKPAAVFTEVIYNEGCTG